MRTSERGGVRSQTIRGWWDFQGKSSKGKDKFELHRTIDLAVGSINRIYFDGQFNFDGKSEHERDVEITFQDLGNGRICLRGKGENASGVFELRGIAERIVTDAADYKISIEKEYMIEETPWKEIVENKMASSVSKNTKKSGQPQNGQPRKFRCWKKNLVERAKEQE